jgi:predicted MFS family arabinose efflux permease
MRRVLELPAFRRLLVATVLNELALSIGAVALALLVYRRTGSAIGAAGFFLCAEFAPAFTSPVLVVRLDQRSVRRALGGLYVLEGLMYLILAWLVRRFALASVLFLSLLIGTFAVTARVLARTAWTSLTSPIGQIRDASAVMGISLSICYMVGPALGGVIVAAAGTRVTLFINVGLLACITAVILTARALPAPADARDPARGRLRAALANVRAQPVIRRLLGLQGVAMIFFAISIPAEVVLAQHTLRAGATGYGSLLSAWGGGGIVGSSAYARWRNLPSRFLISLGASLIGLGMLLMAAAPDLGVAIVGAATAGVGNGIELVAFRATLQEAAPARWRALILSLNESILQAVPGAGILLGGGIAALAGARVAFAAGAGGSLAVAGALWLGLSAVKRPRVADGHAKDGPARDPALTAHGPRS